MSKRTFGTEIEPASDHLAAKLSSSSLYACARSFFGYYYFDFTSPGRRVAARAKVS